MVIVPTFNLSKNKNANSKLNSEFSANLSLTNYIFSSVKSIYVINSLNLFIVFTLIFVTILTRGSLLYEITLTNS